MSLFVYDFKKLDSVTKQLQAGDTSMAEVRVLFELVIESFEATKHRLSKNAEVVLHLHFEDGIVKVQDNQVNDLQDVEKRSVECFRAGIDIWNEPQNCLSFAAEAVQRRLLTQTTTDKGYIDTRIILPPSNIVGRLFSKAGWAMKDRRGSLLPQTF